MSMYNLETTPFISSHLPPQLAGDTLQQYCAKITYLQITIILDIDPLKFANTSQRLDKIFNVGFGLSRIKDVLYGVLEMYPSLMNL